MHFSTVLFTAAAVCATTTSATCFKTGQHWGDHEPPHKALSSLCKDHTLNGHYKPHEAAYACRNSPDKGTSYTFQITNKNSIGVDVTQADCNNYIGDQIDSCGHGGKVTHSGVEYR